MTEWIIVAVIGWAIVYGAWTWVNKTEWRIDPDWREENGYWMKRTTRRVK